MSLSPMYANLAALVFLWVVGPVLLLILTMWVAGRLLGLHRLQNQHEATLGELAAIRSLLEQQANRSALQDLPQTQPPPRPPQP